MDYEILQDAGKISAEIAKLHAETEFEKYRIIQDKLYVSDFDRAIKQITQQNSSVIANANPVIANAVKQSRKIKSNLDCHADKSARNDEQAGNMSEGSNE